jgi:hypothetical protein
MIEIITNKPTRLTMDDETGKKNLSPLINTILSNLDPVLVIVKDSNTGEVYQSDLYIPILNQRKQIKPAQINHIIASLTE